MSAIEPATIFSPGFRLRRAAIPSGNTGVSYSETKYIIVPKYSELSISKIWPFVKEIEDLNAYFPDLEEVEYPEREYLWTIVSTLCSENTKELIKTARNKRTTKERADQNSLIQIDPSIYQEISAIASQKRRFKWRCFK